MLALRRLQVSVTQLVAHNSRLLSSSPVLRGLEEFFDVPTKEGDAPPVVGRGWEASELRTKSFDDLHKLWFVLLKERTMLQSEKGRRKADGQAMPNPTRITKVRKSMARIKQVLSERAHSEPSKAKRKMAKRAIDAL